MRSAPGEHARVVVELVVQVRVRARITLRNRVGVANQIKEGQWLNRIPVGRVEIHVLGKAVRIGRFPVYYDAPSPPKRCLGVVSLSFCFLFGVEPIDWHACANDHNPGGRRNRALADGIHNHC